MDFDFSIALLKPSRCFSVSPERGNVPANGEVAITVSFTPVALVTEETTLKVRQGDQQALLHHHCHATIPGLSGLLCCLHA